MKFKLKISLILVLVFNFILSSWSVLHNDIFYDTDIAKDFLIIDEIMQKKIVLIGPRADFQGLFHGTIWHYFNLPIFLISGGNPIFQGWFWIFLTVLFVAGNYYFSRKLFGKKSAVILLILLSFYLVPYTHGFSNGPAAIFILPFCIYFFFLYFQSADWRYLALHIVCIGILIHLLIAAGAPILLLSLIATVFWIIRKRNYRHLLCWIIIPLFLSPFLLFDIRHNFIQLQSAWKYIYGTRNETPLPFVVSFSDRLTTLMSSGMNFFKFNHVRWNYGIFLYFIYAYWKIMRSKYKTKAFYIIFMYFYIGYYIFSLFHGGLMLPAWWLPISFLAIIVFSTLHLYTPKILYYPLLVIIITMLFYQNIQFITDRSSVFGKAMNSWQFRLSVAKTVFADAPNEFGYFIYSPDFFGYQDKYALSYAQRINNKKAFRFEKKPITYVIVEPVPSNRLQFDEAPALNSDWWIYHQFQIPIKPVVSFALDQGYKINKYQLTEKELQTPSQITTSQWLHFR